MFRATARVETLRTVAEVVSTLVGQVKLQVHTDGLELRAIDPSHVALVEIWLKKSAFEEFAADEAALGLDIPKLKDVLRHFPAEDLVELEHDPGKGQLRLSCGNVTTRIGLLDPSRLTDFTVPSFDPPARAVIATRELQIGVRAAELVSDQVTLDASPEAFEMSSSGEGDSISYRAPRHLLVSLDCTERVQSRFGLGFLSRTVRSFPAELNIAVNLGNDCPVRLEAGGPDRAGYLNYLIAPRVESD